MNFFTSISFVFHFLVVRDRVLAKCCREQFCSASEVKIKEDSFSRVLPAAFFSGRGEQGNVGRDVQLPPVPAIAITMPAY